MFIDASALLAVLLKEPEAASFLRLVMNQPTYTSPLAIYEAVVGLIKQKRINRARAEQDVSELLHEFSTRIIAISSEMGELALKAFDKYGKGRGHPAQLNMGDCFAYACAKSLGVPLLYKGNDFAKTDLA